MRLGSNRAVAALALVFGVLGSSDLGAVRPEPVAEDAGLVTPVWMPLGVSKAPVTVVVQLAGDSVAEQQGYAGRKLERGEKDRIKGQLRSQQDGLRGSIESLGGTVVASYQAAYNGIKVRIAHDRVKELAALPGVVAVRPLQLMKPDNVRGIPLIGTPAVWQSLGLHGEGVKIARRMQRPTRRRRYPPIRGCSARRRRASRAARIWWATAITPTRATR